MAQAVLGPEIVGSGEANDEYGYAVSVSGDTAIIGAYQDNDVGDDSGSAYVYVRSGSTWTQQAKLTASDGADDDEFGFSVSIDGDTAVIGAYRDDDAGSSSGSAYVFVRSGSSWTEQQKLVAADGASNDEFGYAVSVSDDTAVIGAHRDDDVGSSSGSIYIYVRSGSSWTLQQKLTASDGDSSDEFGYAVSVSVTRQSSARTETMTLVQVVVRFTSMFAGGTSWTQQRN